MKIQAALLSLGMVSAAFCLDEYQPIEQKKAEIDVGYSGTFINGSYDADGKKSDVPSGLSPMVTQIPIQVKYGIMTGLDVELGWTFESDNEDVSGTAASGFMQPDIAVKYSLMDMGLAVFVDVNLPMATGDFSPPSGGSTLSLGIAPGVVYGKNFGKIQAVGALAYQVNLENGDKYKNGNVLNVFLKPGYSVDDALGVYLGLQYTMASEDEFDGTAITGTDGNAFVIKPGATYTLSKMLAFEANIPYVLSGMNTFGYWGISAAVYVTVP